MNATTKLYDEINRLSIKPVSNAVLTQKELRQLLSAGLGITEDATQRIIDELGKKYINELQEEKTATFMELFRTTRIPVTKKQGLGMRSAWTDISSEHCNVRMSIKDVNQNEPLVNALARIGGDSYGNVKISPRDAMLKHPKDYLIRMYKIIYGLQILRVSFSWGEYFTYMPIASSKGEAYGIRPGISISPIFTEKFKEIKKKLTPIDIPNYSGLSGQTLLAHRLLVGVIDALGGTRKYAHPMRTPVSIKDKILNVAYKQDLTDPTNINYPEDSRLGTGHLRRILNIGVPYWDIRARAAIEALDEMANHINVSGVERDKIAARLKVRGIKLTKKKAKKKLSAVTGPSSTRSNSFVPARIEFKGDDGISFSICGDEAMYIPKIAVLNNASTHVSLANIAKQIGTGNISVRATLSKDCVCSIPVACNDEEEVLLVPGKDTVIARFQTLTESITVRPGEFNSDEGLPITLERQGLVGVSTEVMALACLGGPDIIL